MLRFTFKDLEAIGERILSMSPEPVPKFRILRDVFRLDTSDPDYRKATAELDSSFWVERLASSQLHDGTWGRFHTQNTKVKQQFPTTQSALRVALDCGLDSEHRIIQRLLPTLKDYVDGACIWPDGQEKHDNPAAWPIWVRHYSAAALAAIDPFHAAIDEFWHIRAQSLAEAFASGVFDRDAEIAALNRLLDCRMKNPVPFHFEPSLQVITATRMHLPEMVERGVINYLLTSETGIYYVFDCPLEQHRNIEDRKFCAWLRALILLSRFRRWNEFSEASLNAVWAQRNGSGVWDVGGKVARKPFTSFPLSDSWRRKENRIIDSTVEVLGLLSTAFR